VRNERSLFARSASRAIPNVSPNCMAYLPGPPAPPRAPPPPTPPAPPAPARASRAGAACRRAAAQRAAGHAPQPVVALLALLLQQRRAEERHLLAGLDVAAAHFRVVEVAHPGLHDARRPPGRVLDEHHRAAARTGARAAPRPGGTDAVAAAARFGPPLPPPLRCHYRRRSPRRAGAAGTPSPCAGPRPPAGRPPASGCAALGSRRRRCASLAGRCRAPPARRATLLRGPRSRRCTRSR
jgi:hypothetical protein